MSSRRVGLSALQRAFLEAFGGRTPDYYLTGGGALVGFYGLERVTHDLDLFTEKPDALAHVDAEIKHVCHAIGAAAQEVRSAPYFRRYQITRGEEVLQIDLVLESTAQILPEKPLMGAVRVDPVEEIFANKICTLVGRAEVRDFWDVYQLAKRGLSFQKALHDAGVKEGGVDAESLVFVLSEIHWPALAGAAAESGLTGWSEVADYFKRLQKSLAVGLAPPAPPGGHDEAAS